MTFFLSFVAPRERFGQTLALLWANAAFRRLKMRNTALCILHFSSFYYIINSQYINISVQIRANGIRPCPPVLRQRGFSVFDAFRVKNGMCCPGKTDDSVPICAKPAFTPLIFISHKQASKTA